MNKIGLIEFFLLRPDVALSLLCWLSQFIFSKLWQPTGQRQSNVRTQQKIFLIGPILFLYYEEVWYHQIWIQNNLGFIVLILFYIPNDFAAKFDCVCVLFSFYIPQTYFAFFHYSPVYFFLFSPFFCFHHRSNYLQTENLILFFSCSSKDLFFMIH